LFPAKNAALRNIDKKATKGLYPSMKRPRLFILIATWCSLVLFVSAIYIMPRMEKYTAPEFQSAHYLGIIAVSFAIWQTIGLCQLKTFNRWFAVGFCGWHSAALVWNATVILPRPNVKLVSASILFTVLIGINALCIWYLSRRSFREFAVQFVAKRKLGPMDEAAQEAIQADIRKMRR
jgi:hypothetical protein